MRKIILTALLAFTIISLSGCAAAQVEKAPVITEDAITPDTASPTAAAPTPYVSPSAALIAPEEANDTYIGTIELEGMEEPVNYMIYENKSLNYHMSYDYDRFTVTSDNGTDSFTAANPDPDLYPYIYINISRSQFSASELSGNLLILSEEIKGTTENSDGHIWSKVIDGKNNIVGYVSSEYVSLGSPDTIKIGDYTAIHYRIKDGIDWNSSVRDYYSILAVGYIYTIETQCYSEAEEGYGARILAMLDTFTIADEAEVTPAAP